MTLREALGHKVLLLDGAMGTMIQSYHLREEDFRGDRFRDIACTMMGNNDILSLTRPNVIRDIHRRYLEAGADIIEVNTFSSNRVCMEDYHCGELVQELNTAAVRLAREVANEYRDRYVVATIGPTNKSLSISPDVENPAVRAITFDQLCDAYEEQMEAILRAGVDGIMLETIFDTLNCKAAIRAKEIAEEKTGIRVPLMLSATINDNQGRLLSGQNLQAFLASVQHADILSVGLNCSFGAGEMLGSLRELADVAPYYISCHPNAGLPNEMGLYDQTPDMMAREVAVFLQEGLVNVIGGCCGTTPEHIRALRLLLDSGAVVQHTPAKPSPLLHLSGLETLKVSPETGFVRVGERCNVAGSRKFLRLIKEGSYDEALSIARKQVDDGALVIDVNMDDGLLDAEKEMTTFLNLIGSDPDICRVPIMIDSSNWDVIRAGLKCVQGKCIVNSISLKEGEEVFLSHAREVHQMGAAVVVMAFDEQGQATTYERRIEICERAYHLLVEEVGFNPSDIIFDPNVLAVATGIPEHDGLALDFIRATGWIHQNLPYAHISGGVSNLSFSFRGNNFIREAMHVIFLHHAQLRGMDFAIVNPSSHLKYEEIPTEQRNVIEEVIVNPSSDASEALISLAEQLLEQKEQAPKSPAGTIPTAKSEEKKSVEERLVESLQKGVTDHLEEDLRQALERYPNVVDIIEGPLMDGMNKVGQLFGEGKMFLPQVVKTARTMKRAVAFLQPYLDAQRKDSASKAGKVLLATVKGDVHDIGKNIVSVVMACNGYEIIDMGVMVPAEDILKKVKEEQPDIIGLSGLITPSLDQMVQVVRLLKQENIHIPVMIGGATTSFVHTALKIAPKYDGSVIWVHDASQNVSIAQRFLSPQTASEAAQELRERQAAVRNEGHTPADEQLSLEEARKRKLNLF